MSKKVLILAGSPRKGGNSDILCDEFLRGAQDAGHKVEKIRVAEKKVAPCSGCYYCNTHGGACVHKDNMADILQKMIDADVIVLASPVYFYAISAQLKAVIDRTVARWLEVKDKEFYYITTMADEEKASADTTLACLGLTRGMRALCTGCFTGGLSLHRHGTILLQRRAGGHSNRKIRCGSQRYFSDHQSLGRALRL